MTETRSFFFTLDTHRLTRSIRYYEYNLGLIRRKRGLYKKKQDGLFKTNMDARVAIRIFISFSAFSIVTAGHPYVGEELYVGCYKRFHADLNVDLPWRECIIKCSFKHFYFAGIKGLSGCYCGNKIGRRVSSSLCKKVSYYAVYTVVPTYMGCFKDSPLKRDMKVTELHPPMTNKRCIEHCSSLNTLFAGTQGGERCSCGNIFGKYGGADNAECNETCAGNLIETCGAKARNSVYSVTHLQGLGLNFDRVFHCEEEHDVLGYCTKGKCKPGWQGPKCDQRDCKVLNGHCGAHKCVDLLLKGNSVHECICNRGFSSYSLYHNCEDLDECEAAYCLNEEDSCVNAFGSHVCSTYEEQDMPEY